MIRNVSQSVHLLCQYFDLARVFLFASVPYKQQNERFFSMNWLRHLCYLLIFDFTECFTDCTNQLIQDNMILLLGDFLKQICEKTNF